MRKGRIVDLYKVMPKDGDVGIEIEMEGTNLSIAHDHGLRKWAHEFPWDFKMDGSLRGESCEWVLAKPVKRADVNSSLGKLWDAAEAVNAKFNPSRRCGVHVHMNVQDLTEQQVFNLIGTYIAFENLLVRWAGDDREGNLFCLRASDARELIDQLTYAKAQGNLACIMNDQIRYASVNLNSIKRYGSLEFRALGTPAQPTRISQWVRMLYCIRELSLEFKDLRELLYKLSASNAREFITTVFGARSVLRLIEDKEDLLRDGMRNVQDLLVTQSSRVFRNSPNLPGPGWHVIDERDPDARRRRAMQEERMRLMPAGDPLDFAFDDMPDEPHWDEDIDPEEDQ